MNSNFQALVAPLFRVDSLTKNVNIVTILLVKRHSKEDMRHFERIYEIAVGHNGIVTNADASRAGITTSEIARYCKDGRLERIGYGVYRPRHYVPTRLTRYAAALALVGDGAFIHGVSVVRMLGLIREGAGEEDTVCVATTRRVRRKLPSWLCVRRASSSSACVEYDGLLSQPLDEALRESASSIGAQALRSAAERAVAGGLLARDLYDALGFRVVPLTAQRSDSGLVEPTVAGMEQVPQTLEG